MYFWTYAIPVAWIVISLSSLRLFGDYPVILGICGGDLSSCKASNRKLSGIRELLYLVKITAIYFRDSLQVYTWRSNSHNHGPEFAYHAAGIRGLVLIPCNACWRPYHVNRLIYDMSFTKLCWKKNIVKLKGCSFQLYIDIVNPLNFKCTKLVTVEIIAPGRKAFRPLLQYLETLNPLIGGGVHYHYTECSKKK